MNEVFLYKIFNYAIDENAIVLNIQNPHYFPKNTKAIEF
jgi:hypothetical protein